MVYKFLQLFAIFVVFSFFLAVGFSELSLGDSSIEFPRKQLEKGIDLKDVLCKSDYMLVISQSDKLACLSETIFLKLDERGYIKSVIKKFTQESSPEKIKKEEVTPTVESNVRSGSTIKGDTGKASTGEITDIPASGASFL